MFKTCHIPVFPELFSPSTTILKFFLFLLLILLFVGDAKRMMYDTLLYNVYYTIAHTTSFNTIISIETLRILKYKILMFFSKYQKNDYWCQ